MCQEHTGCHNENTDNNSGRTYVVKASTKSSELRDEKPLNIKNDRLNALEVHSFI